MLHSLHIKNLLFHYCTTFRNLCCAWLCRQINLCWLFLFWTLHQIDRRIPSFRLCYRLVQCLTRSRDHHPSLVKLMPHLVVTILIHHILEKQKITAALGAFGGGGTRNYQNQTFCSKHLLVLLKPEALILILLFLRLTPLDIYSRGLVTKVPRVSFTKHQEGQLSQN